MVLACESWHKIMRWSLFVEKIVFRRTKLPCIIPIVLFHIFLFGMKNCLYLFEHWQELLACRSLSDSYLLRAAKFEAFCLHLWKVFWKLYWPWSEYSASLKNCIEVDIPTSEGCKGLFPFGNLIGFLLISDRTTTNGSYKGKAWILD